MILIKCHSKHLRLLQEIEHLGGSKGFHSWLHEAKPLPVHHDAGTLSQYMSFNVKVDGSMFHTTFHISADGIGIPFATTCTAFGAGKHGEYKAHFFFESWNDLLGHEVEYSIVPGPLFTGGVTISFFHEKKLKGQLTIGSSYNGLACGKGNCEWV
jgi:hypothetical protein